MHVHIYTRTHNFTHTHTSFVYSEITNPPVSVSARLDTWASFHCEGEGDVLVWQTNEGPVTEEIKETRNITIYQDNNATGILNSTLVIFAKPENDGLNIGCTIGLFGGSFVFDSASANVFVRGNNITERIYYV